VDGKRPGSGIPVEYRFYSGNPTFVTDPNEFLDHFPLAHPGGTMRRTRRTAMSEDTRTVIGQFHDALNNHDLAALAPLVHDECVFETTEPPDGTRHVGRDAVLTACRAFFEQSPDARFVMEEFVAVDDRALVRWRYDWPDGHVRGVDVMRVRDGKVIETFAYVKG
jgi:ketosteroid isomerase-like protein